MVERLPARWRGQPFRYRLELPGANVQKTENPGFRKKPQMGLARLVEPASSDYEDHDWRTK